MWAITARFAHCQRCTSCSRHYCMEDYTQCLTKIKQEIRRASEKPTRQRIILRRTECWNRNAKSGESKCGQRRSTSRRRSTPSPTTLSGRHSYLAMSIMDTFVSWGKFTKIRRRQYRQTKRARFSISKKALNRAIHCPACSSTRCCSMH